MPMLRFGVCSSHLHKIEEDSNGHNQKIERADNNLLRRYHKNRINLRGSVVFNYRLKKQLFHVYNVGLCNAISKDWSYE